MNTPLKPDERAAINEFAMTQGKPIADITDQLAQALDDVYALAGETREGARRLGTSLGMVEARLLRANEALSAYRASKEGEGRVEDGDPIAIQTENYRRRTIAKREACQKEGDAKCSDCGQPWEQHEFGVPKPYCPSKEGEKVEYRVLEPNEIIEKGDECRSGVGPWVKARLSIGERYGRQHTEHRRPIRAT